MLIDCVLHCRQMVGREKEFLIGVREGVRRFGRATVSRQGRMVPDMKIKEEPISYRQYVSSQSQSPRRKLGLRPEDNCIEIFYSSCLRHPTSEPDASPPTITYMIADRKKQIQSH